MALFKRDFNKPGPGVPKNAPRKRGPARLWEVLVRDFGSLVKLNLIYQVCLLPTQALFAVSILTIGSWWSFLFAALALAGCIPLGAAKTAVSYLITKMLRDDPGFLWHDFKKAFKSNFKSALLPGLLFGLIVGGQVYSYLLLPVLSGGGGLPVLVLFCFSVLIFAMIAPYYFLQAGYLQLSFFPMLKNSLLLALGNAPRSLVGAIFGTGLVVVQWLFFPLPLPLTILVGYTLPALLNLMWIWPVADRTFGIEETLVKRGKDVLDSSAVGEESENSK